MSDTAFSKSFARSGVALSRADIKALSSLEANAVRVMKGESLVEEGETTDLCGVLVEGWMIRQKTLADGRRQVVDVLPGGSLFAMNSLGVAHADEALVMLTAGQVAWFSPEELKHALAASPPAMAAMLWAGATESAILSERILTLGRRSAKERMAHYFIEMGRRLRARGLDASDHYRLPLTQELLGDLLGMTSVHANRTLRQLEKEGFIRRHGGQIELKLTADLYRLAGFAPDYLHEEDAAVARKRRRHATLRNVPG
jgi:CRP-like cAMP-binding protein